jgi:hypothetical protein
MVKNYQWYNNGDCNIKITNNIPPKGFVKGYLLHKKKNKKLDRINKDYEKKIEKFIKDLIENIDKKMNKLNFNFLIEQQKIYPDTVKSISKESMPVDKKIKLMEILSEEFIKMVNLPSKKYIQTK